VNHLRESGNVSTLGLWGRSMGAATALLHGDRDPSIAGMVVDSAFSDLETLARELVDIARNQGYSIPGFVVSSAISMIKSSVRSKANFEIKDLQPIAHADSCFIPALFCHATGDEFIQPHHSDDIHAKYAGDKNIIKVDGDHNTPRPHFFLDSAVIFLSQALQVPPQLVLDGEGIHSGRMPWQQAGGAYRGFYTAQNTVVSPTGSPQARQTFDDFDEEQMQMVLAASLAENGGGEGGSAVQADVQEDAPAAQGDAPRIAEAATSIVEPDPEKVTMLIDMGFQEPMVREYLAKTNNDMEAAVQCMVSQ